MIEEEYLELFICGDLPLIIKMKFFVKKNIFFLFKENYFSDLPIFASRLPVSTTYSYGLMVVGLWSNGYRCGMRIPRPGFNSQRSFIERSPEKYFNLPDHGC